MGLFEQSENIFRDEDVLKEDYEPSSLEERDDEINEFMPYLQPVINGKQPLNVFLYGKTGVGKTAVTKYLLSHLVDDAEQYDGVDVGTVYVNCEDYDTSYRVAVRLVNTFRDDENQLSETGHARSVVYSRLWQTLERVGGTVLIVLDEVDYLGDDDSILYQLPRARANGNLSDAAVGIIGISNDLTYRDRLDPRVEDTLCEREIHFAPYEAPQLQNILRKRVDQAFHPGVVDDAAIHLCAALASRDKGSARQALDILLEAGYIARQNDDESVTEAHVRAGQEKLQNRKIEESMRDLTSHYKYTLASLIDVTADGTQTPVPRQPIYNRYEKLVTESGMDPLVERSIHNHLKEMSMLGIIKSEQVNEGINGGIYYRYELAVNLETALSSLNVGEDLDAFSEKKVRQRARHHNVI